MDPFAATVVAFLDEVGVRHSEIRFRGGSDGNVFDLHHGIQIDGDQFYWEISGNISRRILTIWTYPLLTIPEDRLTAVAEYALRANYGLWLGGFEMEYCVNGRIGFKASVCMDGIEPGFAMLREWLYASFGGISTHAPYIRRVISGELTPFEALNALEMELKNGLSAS